MPSQNIQEQLAYELYAMYDAERRFLDGQQAMIQQATDTQLQESLRTHIDQTHGHIANLERIFSLLGRQSSGIASAAAEGLVGDARQATEQAGTAALRDVAIGGAADKVEHFEITCYTLLIDLARAAGQQQIIAVLQQNLQHEQQAAQQLERLGPQLLRIAQAGATQAGGPTGVTIPVEEGARSTDEANVDIDTSVPVDVLIGEMEGPGGGAGGNT